MNNYLKLSCILAVLALACLAEPSDNQPASGNTDGGGESREAGRVFAKQPVKYQDPNRPAVHTYTVEWEITVDPIVPLAAGRGPHVCTGLWISGVCMQCVANKSLPDSVCADVPGGWDPPIWTPWGGRMGNHQ